MFIYASVLLENFISLCHFVSLVVNLTNCHPVVPVWLLRTSGWNSLSRLLQNLQGDLYIGIICDTVSVRYNYNIKSSPFMDSGVLGLRQHGCFYFSRDSPGKVCLHPVAHIRMGASSLSPFWQSIMKGLKKPSLQDVFEKATYRDMKK